MRKPVAAALAAVVLSALAACSSGGGGGSSAPAMVKVRGSFDYSIASTCQESELTGAQVRITSASGTVLATAVLPERGTVTSMDGVDVLRFAYAATVPAEARYGIAIGTIAPYYVTRAQFTKGVDLSC